jgi:hypothetical protein
MFNFKNTFSKNFEESTLMLNKAKIFILSKKLFFKNLGIAIIFLMIFVTGFPEPSFIIWNFFMEQILKYFNFLDGLRGSITKTMVPLKRPVISSTIPFWETKITILIPILALINYFFLSNLFFLKQKVIISNNKFLINNITYYKEITIKIFFILILNILIFIFLAIFGIMFIKTLVNSQLIIEFERQVFKEFILWLYRDVQILNLIEQYKYIIPESQIHARILYISKIADFSIRDSVYMDMNQDTRLDLYPSLYNKKFPKEFGITHLDEELLNLLESKWILFKIVKGSILY